MILLIDTSQETGTTALAEKGKVLFSEENKIAKEHASWLHVAIGRMLAEAKITVRDLEAIAVVAGPGSYTGLRVGMAAVHRGTARTLTTSWSGRRPTIRGTRAT